MVGLVGLLLASCVGVDGVSAPQTGRSDWSGPTPSRTVAPTPLYLPPEEYVAWATRDWPDYRLPDLEVTMELIAEMRPDPPPVLPVQASRRVAVPMAPDAIRTLISQYFNPADVPLMLRVAWCESRYNVTAANPNSSARGLFQIMAGWYNGTWASNAPFDPYDAHANVSFAAYLFYEGGGISHWNPSRGCWG